MFSSLKSNVFIFKSPIIPPLNIEIFSLLFPKPNLSLPLSYHSVCSCRPQYTHPSVFSDFFTPFS